MPSNKHVSQDPTQLNTTTSGVKSSHIIPQNQSLQPAPPCLIQALITKNEKLNCTLKTLLFLLHRGKMMIHPSGHCEIRLFSRKNVWQMPQINNY